MGCNQSKKPDQRVEKTLARLNEKEKQLDMLIQQHQDLINKHDTNSQLATQKIPNGSTNEIKVNDGNQNKIVEQNILPKNILDQEDNKSTNLNNDMQMQNQNTDNQLDMQQKTPDKNKNDNNNTNNVQKQSDTNIPQNQEKNKKPITQNGIRVVQLNLNIDEVQQQTQQSVNQKTPQNQNQPTQQQMQQQQIHVVQSEQVYNSNNIIRITDDYDELTMQTDKKTIGQNQRNFHSIIKTQPTQRLSRGGDDGERKQTEDEVQQWANLISAFDDVSIRPIDNFQDKDQALSADQIELDLGSQQKSQKQNMKPQISPSLFVNNQQPFNTLPVGTDQSKFFLANKNSNSTDNLNRPKTMQNPFDHLIHHPDIMKMYQKVSNSILVNNSNQKQ